MRHVIIAAALLLPSSAGAPLPTFKFDPPAGFLGGGDSFRPNSMHQATIQIVSFRPFSGSLEQEVDGPLAAEWARQLGREVRVVGRKERTAVAVPGADAASVSKMQEDYWGTPSSSFASSETFDFESFSIPSA